MEEFWQEPLGPPIQIEVSIRATIITQQWGEYFEAYVIITAECAGKQKSWVMRPWPYNYTGLDKGPEWEEVKARWQTQFDWIRRNNTAPSLFLVESLINQAYDSESVNISQPRRKLQYTKRQAQRVKELLPEREKFWRQARAKHDVRREGIWPSLIEAFDERITTRRKAPKITRPKWKSGQIALIHAAMDAGITLRNDELLSMQQWKTVKREIVDREW